MNQFNADLAALSNASFIATSPFAALSMISRYFTGDEETANQGRELLFRLLENKSKLPKGCLQVLSALIEAAGLYPYLNTNEGWRPSTANMLSYEAHRPHGTQDIVLHEGQLDAYLHLLKGENVVLSAPTSFGKSLLIDVMIMSQRYANIVVIVPTIALIDETRRRLANRFGDVYKIITHPTQSRADRNIYVLTQERYLELYDIPKIEFFVIDEFYKLSPTTTNGEEFGIRTTTLNIAFLKLLKSKAQFLLIGPNIEEVKPGRPSIKFYFKRTEFKTVGTESHRINVRGKKEDECLKICQGREDSTLIFCGSIPSVCKLAAYLVDNGISVGTEESNKFAEWVAESFSAEWSLVRFLRAGIAIHHASLPRSIAQYMLHLFNKGDVRFLLCTSTIIEGVNTSAKNIVVYDNVIAKEKYDYFTFNNIKGRAGRMFKHYVGRIFILNDEPQQELPLVEIPAITLPDNLPVSMAMEVEENAVNDLSEASIEKLRYLHAQHDLPYEIIKANTPIDPDTQLEIAHEIMGNSHNLAQLLTWKDSPTYDQLFAVSSIIVDKMLKPQRKGQYDISTGKQLCFKIWQMQQYLPNGFRAYIANVRMKDTNSPSIDDVIRGSLSFLRNWAEYKIPIYMMAINRIQQYVFSKCNITPGDYTAYANRIKHWFRHPSETILEEYGIPMQITEKIRLVHSVPEDVDGILSSIRLGGMNANLSQVEREIFRLAFRG